MTARPASTPAIALLFARLALALFAVAIALVTAEGGLRLWAWSHGIGRPDIQDLLRQSQLEPSEVHTSELFGVVQPAVFPDIIYELRPSVHGTFREQPYRSNAFGLRGPETELAKPKNVFRIATLGDSHMFGWGVGEGESYVDRLRAEGLTTDDGRRVELLNFACPGYNAAIETAVYEHKIRLFDPDLLLLHYVGNDGDFPHFLQPPRRFTPGDWYLADLVQNLLAPRGLDGELELLPHDLREVAPEERDAAAAHYAYMLGESGYRKAMRRLARLTAKDGVPVIVLMLGERPDVVATLEPLGFAWLDAAPQWVAHLGHLGIELTEENGKEIWTSTYKIPRDGHPTVEAHVAYAELLTEALAKRGIVATRTDAPDRAPRESAEAPPRSAAR
jgi:alginate O-acetyltransferase complex protein AlgI